MALENLRRESAIVRSELTELRSGRLLPSLAITKQQQAKLRLQRELQQLLQIQRVEAILMAAENSCVNRELPLQAALLVEGAALSLSSEDSSSSSDLPVPVDDESSSLSIQSGVKRVRFRTIVSYEACLIPLCLPEHKSSTFGLDVRYSGSSFA